LPRLSKRDEWTGRLIFVAFGIYVLIWPNPDSAKLILGVPLTFGPLLESHEFRIAFKIVINRVSGKEVFQVQQSHIIGSNVVGSAQEVHFHQAPQTIIPPPVIVPQIQPEPVEPDWEVDEEFTLTDNDPWRDFEFDLEEGEELTGVVESDENVSCYVLGRASFRSFREEETFDPYWSSEAVTKTKVSFVAPGARTYYLVVAMDEQDEDDYEDISVSVKLLVGT
jgi:hypothetical protein